MKNGGKTMSEHNKLRKVIKKCPLCAQVLEQDIAGEDIFRCKKCDWAWSSWEIKHGKGNPKEGVDKETTHDILVAFILDILRRFPEVYNEVMSNVEDWGAI